MSLARRIWVAPALAAVAVVMFARSLFGGSTIFLRDHLSLVVPARHFLGESLGAKNFPEWWDAVGMGVPFAANPMHGALYPLAWISLVAPDSFGADLIIVIHVLLLGIGVAALARRLGAEASGAFVGGAVAMASGYVGSMTQNGVPLLTLAWLPWVACTALGLADAEPWNVRCRAALRLAAVLAMAILSGDPAGVITAGLLALTVIATRGKAPGKAVVGLLLSSAGALLLAAMVVVPAVYLMGQGSRAGGVASSEALSWSMHPLRIAEWVWPQMLGNPADPSLDLARVFANSSVDRAMGPQWSLSVFLGLPVLVLVANSGKRKLLLASLLFAVLAMGRYTPFYEIYRYLFVPERAIRFPERHLAGLVVLWAALAGVGWTRLLASSGRLRWGARSWEWPLAAVAAALLAASGLAFLGSSWLVGRVGGAAAAAGIHADAAVALSIRGLLVASASLATFAIAARLLRTPATVTFAKVLAVAAILCPLWRDSVAVRPVVDRQLVSGIPNVLKPVLGKTLSSASGPRPRLYRNRTLNPRRGPGESRGISAAGLYHSAKPNMGAASGIAYVPGYDPSLSNRLRAAWEEGASQGARLLRLFDVEFVFVPRTVALGSGMEIVANSLDPGLVLARQPGRRPRAFVASRWKWVESDREARALMFAGELDLSTVRLVGTGPASAMGGGELVACAQSAPTPETVTLSCDAPNPGYAVLLDAWAPGWIATVDGNPAEIIRAEGLVRAVAVPAGLHSLLFRYRTPGLRLGLLLSGLAWSLWGLLVWLLRRSEKKARVLCGEA